MSDIVGHHIIADFQDCGCESRFLDTAEAVRGLLREACRTFDVLRIEVHQFDPCGATGIALLKESHCSVHTWPERKIVCCDIFTCQAKSGFPERALQHLQDIYQPNHAEVTRILRGAHHHVDRNGERLVATNPGSDANDPTANSS